MDAKRFWLIVLLLLFVMQTDLYAQASRTGTLGLRFDGGASWSLGSGFANVGTSSLNETQPLFTAGMYFNFSPRFRAGLDYDYSRLVREQLDGSQTALPGGGSESVVYRDLKTHFHGVTLTGEYNLLGSMADSPFSLYAGAGAGCLFAVGNTYEIGVKNEIVPGGMGNTVQVTGHNEGHRFILPCFPLSLSLEYAFLPQVSLSLGGGYRFIVAGKHGLSPKGQASATLGLRFNLWK